MLHQTATRRADFARLGADQTPAIERDPLDERQIRLFLYGFPAVAVTPSRSRRTGHLLPRPAQSLFQIHCFRLVPRWTDCLLMQRPKTRPMMGMLPSGLGQAAGPKLRNRYSSQHQRRGLIELGKWKG